MGPPPRLHFLPLSLPPLELSRQAVKPKLPKWKKPSGDKRRPHLKHINCQPWVTGLQRNLALSLMVFQTEKICLYWALSKSLITRSDSIINGHIVLHFGVIYAVKVSATDLGTWKHTIVVIKSKTCSIRNMWWAEAGTTLRRMLIRDLQWLLGEVCANVIARWRKENSCSVVMTSLSAVTRKTHMTSSELMDPVKANFR